MNTLFWLFQSPETNFAFALLLIMVTVMVTLALSRKKDARMDFLVDLMRGFPAAETALSGLMTEMLGAWGTELNHLS